MLAQAQQALADPAGFFEAIIASSDDAIISKTLDGVVISWNPGAQRMFGYAASEMIGQPMARIFPPDRVQEEPLILQKIARGDKVDHFDTVRMRRDGTPVDVSVTISPVRNADGQVVMASTIARDITERKLAERTLQDYRQTLEQEVRVRTRELEEAKNLAEQASAAKSTFLANMSHEIRTPMNAIIGLTHLLQLQIEDPRYTDKLAKITASAKHLLGILNDILDLSKIESGHFQLESANFTVGAVTDQVRSMMSERAHSKRLNLVVDVPAEVQARPLRGDPLRIGQVLINFLSNAIKFTDQGGVVLRARLDAAGEHPLVLRFEVQDSGIGLTPEHISRIFSPFEQAETSTTRKYGGTGLGLAICRRLAHLMGGEVGVSSQPGRGSTFWLTCQVSPGQADPAPDTAPWRPAREGRVLLVEDNEINQEVAAQLLRHQGLTVDIATQGQEAVERVQGTSYDLILMDMQMPVMDGVQATRLIRDLPYGRTVPILAMTANAFEEDRKRCAEVGMNDHITKPVDPHFLYSALARWMPSMHAVQSPSTPASGAFGASAELASRPDLAPLHREVGLRYFGGNAANYDRILQKFVTLHGQDAEVIHAAFTQGRWSEVEHMAHALKGISGSLGAVLLHALAAQVEAAARDVAQHRKLPGLMPELASALTQVVRQIQTQDDPARHSSREADGASYKDIDHNDTERNDRQGQDPHATRSSLTRLQEMLLGDDPQAQDLWRAVAPQVPADWPRDEVAALARHIENFDFPLAAQSLHALMSQRPQG